MCVTVSFYQCDRRPNDAMCSFPERPNFARMRLFSKPLYINILAGRELDRKLAVLATS